MRQTRAIRISQETYEGLQIIATALKMQFQPPGKVVGALVQAWREGNSLHYKVAARELKDLMEQLS